MLAVALALAGFPASVGAGLEEYLAHPEVQAGWGERGRERAEGGEVIRLELISQVWKGIPWKHDLRVFRPDRLETPELALLFVTGDTGSLGADEDALASAAGVTVAVLGGVPNQPLFDGRYEDDLIAYTFERYLQTGDDEWPLLLPMTKAVVEAMDAVQEVSRRSFGAPIERFVVSGASKRGWTSWLTGAFDLRVAGIVPAVFDNLNFVPQLRNQHDTWGRYSPQLGDYTARGLPALTETERGRELLAIVDPWWHRERLARTRKLIANGTNDPYWAVDAIRFYWDDLRGEKALVYVPNGGHGIAPSARVRDATVAFVRRVAAGKPMPSLEVDGAGRTLRVAASEEPVDARLWSAAAASRDFRRARFESQPMRRDGEGFVTSVGGDAGFVACFAEVDFRESGRTFSIATPVRIVEPAAPAQ